MRRGILYISFCIGAIFFFGSPFYVQASLAIPDGTHYSSSVPIVWKISDSPVLVKGEVTVESNAELIIEPGVVVKLEYQKGKINIFGKLTAVGKKDKRITFTSSRDEPARGDWKNINFGGSEKSNLEYTNVLYAGGYGSSEAIFIGGNDNVSVTKSEIRANEDYGIKISNAAPIIEENIITENYSGIISYGGVKNPTIKNNSIFGNLYWGATVMNPVSGALMGHIDARDNWWGDVAGPRHASNPFATIGDKVSDDVLYSPWLSTDSNAKPPPGPDPVIIIPGIMGSWEKDCVWQIDPIFHTYDNLIEAMIAAGYKNDGKELSVFPYEWRDSNIENAKLLGARIKQIKEQTGRLKVDIVAHSMGGLLAREYIESDYYAEDVDQLITLGTPQLGAPKDYIKWEAGAFFSDIFELAGKKFFEHEAKEKGYDSIFHYIHGRPMESVRELLPVYDYLWDDNGTDYDLRVGYPDEYPRNEFLENLNKPENVEKLKNVEFTKIVGRMNDIESTISGYNTVDADMGELWEHGYPHGFEVPILSDQGFRTSDGDITVPLISSESTTIPSQKTIYYEFAHNKLPTYAQKDILGILTGTEPENEINECKIDDILIGLVFSPVDVQIISPSGKRLGKNFDDGEYNEIKGAYYSGFDTNIEFFTIPDPEEGDYQIIAEGKENGSYKVEINRITENQNDPNNAKEITGVIRGVTQERVIQEAKVNIGEEKIVAIDIRTIRENVEHYAALGYIYNSDELDYYLARLNFLEKLIDWLKGEKKNKKSADKIKKELDLHIDHLIRHIQKSKTDSIDKKVAELFIEDIEDLRDLIIGN